MATRANAPLCVIALTYTVPTEEVDLHMKAHVAWLEAGFAEGIFLVAGRQVPRTGGIIIARGRRAEVEALTASDPFVSEGVATVAVTEFATSFTLPELAALLA